MKRAALRKTARGYDLSSPYDLELIAIVKSYSGRWDSTAKQWWFASETNARSAMNALKTELGYTVATDVPEDEEVARLRAKVRELESRRAPAVASDQVLDDLLRQGGLPMYRALTKQLHPDAGGDHTWMVRVNAAWSRVDKSRDRA